MSCDSLKNLTLIRDIKRNGNYWSTFYHDFQTISSQISSRIYPFVRICVYGEPSRITLKFIQS